MAMCHMTLREWLDIRNKTDNFQMFYENFLAKKYFNAPTLGQQYLSDDSSHTSHDDSSESSSLDCEGDDESPSHLDVVKNIFGQLLSGLEYIHSQVN